MTTTHKTTACTVSVANKEYMIYTLSPSKSASYRELPMDLLSWYLGAMSGILARCISAGMCCLYYRDETYV